MATAGSKRRNGDAEPGSPLQQTPTKKARNNDDEPESPVRVTTTTDAEAAAAEPAPTPALESSETLDRVSPPSPAAPPQSLISSPPASDLGGTQQATQLSQSIPFPEHSDSQTEIKTGVWGYLTSLTDVNVNLTLKKRENSSSQEGKAAGYLIGRHRECDLMLTDRLVSNRHCVIFMESSSDGPKAWIEDLSSNGTRIKGTTIGRNNRRLLNDADEIEISPNCILLFRYPRHRFIGRFAEAYKLGPLLGSGHFASVYKATSTTTGRLVAVKLFLNARRVSSFQQEVAVLMSVTHPSILSLRETFDEADRVYLILEYCPLGELFNLIIDRSKLSEPDTRHIFTQLFDGTQYLHERGIVHRDIKPENILVVDASLTVKLADFGLAKIIGEDSFTTSLCGTPSYVAPEVLANSKERQYSIPVDIWSLGVVLYICLCGFPPFSDELFSPDYPYNLVQQISEGLYEFPSPYWDAIADPALELISAMLCVDPDKRIGVREARRHAWMVGEEDATSEISEGLEGLGLKRRRGRRERTLICEMEGSRVGTGLSEETVRPLREVKGAGNVLEKAKKVAEGKVKGVENEKEGKKEEVETVQASEVEDERGEPVDEA